MRLVFMGTPEFAVPSLDAMIRAGHAVAAAVTRPDRPRRHGLSRPEPSPVKATAAGHGIPVLQPDRPAETGFIEALRRLAPEAVVVVAYGRILPAVVLEIPPHGCINVHASLLPRWRGAAPVARAIMAGDTRTGVTTMRLDRGLDTGDLLLAQECPIGRAETAGELTARLAVMGAGVLVETLARLERGDIEPRPQDGALATPAPPLRVEEGRLDWGATASGIARLIRGCNPWPMAVAGLRGRRIQILRAVDENDGDRRVEDPDAPQPGVVIEAAGDRIVTACGGGTRLAILEMRLPGRRAVSARDAVNGRLVQTGERFAAPPD